MCDELDDFIIAPETAYLALRPEAKGDPFLLVSESYKFFDSDYEQLCDQNPMLGITLYQLLKNHSKDDLRELTSLLTTHLDNYFD
jgi:hypothetical protein